MNIHTLFDQASSAMTVVSFVTFLGILWWTFIRHRSHDFDDAAQLPFADEAAMDEGQKEQRHV
jgi:cytochrome c oxidase cbb3-type subunit IV